LAEANGNEKLTRPSLPLAEERVVERSNDRVSLRSDIIANALRRQLTPKPLNRSSTLSSLREKRVK
jgi:hypothetical protein